MSGSDATPSADSQGPIDPEAPWTALVEIEPGVAVLYGDHVPEGLDLVPLTLFDARAQESMSDAISKATGLANVAAQGINGVMQAQGLIRLAPETLKLLQAAKPMTSGGWNLGALVGSNGKIAAQIRWLPAAGASTAGVAAALGPAIAMLAIQFQLTEIASLAKHNIELTSTVLTEARRERRAAVNGDYAALTEMIGHARHVGSVSPAIFMEVQGSKRNLEAHWETMRGTVRSHVDNLGSKRSHKQHREYLLDNGEAILPDAQALLLAQSSWFMYQALWAGYLLNTADSDPRDAELLQRVINDARQLHAQSLAETDRLLDQVGREFAVMRVLEGKRTLPFSAERRASKDVGRMARQLQESLATIRVQVLTPQEAEVAAPTISVFEGGVPDVLLRVLRLRLEPEERLAALASAVITASNGDRWTALAAAGTTMLSGDSWTAVTDQRVLIMRPDDLKRYGVIEREVPVEDIRYVRTRDRGPDKGPAIDLITKDDNITFEFRAWAKSDDCRLKAERFGDVLGQFMNLPASEIPTFRVRELESGR